MVAAATSVPVKVMLELPLLNEAQKRAAVTSSVAAGVAYVKNASSGAIGVATAEDIAWLRANVPASTGVKASGGITSVAQVRALLAAGADLIGPSAGVQIVTDRNGATTSC